MSGQQVARASASLGFGGQEPRILRGRAKAARSRPVSARPSRPTARVALAGTACSLDLHQLGPAKSEYEINWIRAEYKATHNDNLRRNAPENHRDSRNPTNIARHYRIVFHDDASRVVRVIHVKAGSLATAFLLVVENGWPPGAMRARIIDEYGWRGVSVSKPQQRV
jgi:hypothetical protein